MFPREDARPGECSVVPASSSIASLRGALIWLVSADPVSGYIFAPYSGPKLRTPTGRRRPARHAANTANTHQQMQPTHHHHIHTTSHPARRRHSPRRTPPPSKHTSACMFAARMEAQQHGLQSQPQRSHRDRHGAHISEPSSAISTATA
jgi:hypothetical protein